MTDISDKDRARAQDASNPDAGLVEALRGLDLTGADFWQQLIATVRHHDEARP